MNWLLRRFRYFWAHIVTGYGEITLRSEHEHIIVSVMIRGREVDVIREYVGDLGGCCISHCVTSLGIREDWDRVRTGNPDMHCVSVKEGR